MALSVLLRASSVIWIVFRLTVKEWLGLPDHIRNAFSCPYLRV